MKKSEALAGTVTAEWLAQQLGIEVPDLAKVPSIGKPDKHGNYSADAVEGAFSFLRAVIGRVEEQRDWMTQGELAEMLGVSVQRVCAMTKEGIFRQRTDSRYPRRETELGAANYFREKAWFG